MSSVRTIARHAGVSITTVSRVLNNHPSVSEEVRQRVLSATNRSGYTPSVGKKSTTNIALLFMGENSLGSPFDGAIMHGMSKGMDEYGYDLMILDARRSRMAGESLSQMMIRKGVRGAVVRTTLPTRNAVLSLADESFPFVVVADRFEDPRINYVYSDSAVASIDAIGHLVALGHKRIGMVLNMVDDSDHADRLAGYRQGLDEHGLPFDEKLIFRAAANREGGIQVLRHAMMRADRPTALYLADPMTAVGLLAEARRTGVRVPEDLSIVGFDDADLRYMLCPELTCVCQDATNLGKEAFNALHDLLEGGHTGVRRTLRTWLEIHASTGPVV